MTRTIPKSALLLAAAGLALAACREEPPVEATKVAEPPVPNVSVASMNAAVWPPMAAVEAAATAITAAPDPFAENNMIVLDMSGSMDASSCSGAYSNRAEAAKAALLTWIAANPGDNVGLVSFSSVGINMDAPLGRGEAHAEALVGVIRGLLPDRSTPLREAMQIAQAELEKQAARQGGTGAYRMIVITDGEASKGQEPAGVVADITGNPANMIEVHTIGFCIDGGHSLKDPERVFYTDANSPEALKAGLDATQGEAMGFDAATIDFEELQQ